MTLSVCIISYNEETNIGRTLASVQELVRAVGGEIIVVDSGSTDRTREIAESFGAKVFVEEWEGFAAQKNSAIEKATGDWILSLDADEELDEELQSSVAKALGLLKDGALASSKIDLENYNPSPRSKECFDAFFALTGSQSYIQGFYLRRKNMFLNRWIRHGGFWPDAKLRLFHKHVGRFEPRLVHEDVKVDPRYDRLATFPHGALIHHAYPTLDVYLEHMRRYADLGAEMIRHKPRTILLLNRWLNPPLTFLYNYIFRLGFLDGREGFLLHWNHSRYVAWKYAKAWELSRTKGR